MKIGYRWTEYRYSRSGNYVLTLWYNDAQVNSAFINEEGTTYRIPPERKFRKGTIEQAKEMLWLTHANELKTQIDLGIQFREKWNEERGY